MYFPLVVHLKELGKFLDGLHHFFAAAIQKGLNDFDMQRFGRRAGFASCEGGRPRRPESRGPAPEWPSLDRAKARGS